MNDSSEEPPLLHSIRSWFRPKAHVSNLTTTGSPSDHNPTSTANPSSDLRRHDVAQHTSATLPGIQSSHVDAIQQTPESALTNGGNAILPHPSGPPVDKKEDGAESPTMNLKAKTPMHKRFLNDCKRIIFCSWINWLLIFVFPAIVIGVVERAQGDNSSISPTVVFSLNAIAIIPLASLLAFATESVAAKMGDTIGALLNVTFGNATELIVFIIALVANEIQIVQAAALGSILSNLLLILGMCFLFGGLRFREQVNHHI